MSEFFIVANSFAAPFISDESTHYVKARTAPLALEQFAAKYNHPAGLYAALACWTKDRAGSQDGLEGHA